MIFGPCAKRRTQAVLTGKSGKVYVAENVCLNPQPVCPRAEGEGYEKCSAICQQVGHAEPQVLNQAGSDAVGGTLRVSHWYVCEDCARLCQAAGIAHIEFTEQKPDGGIQTKCSVKL